MKHAAVALDYEQRIASLEAAVLDLLASHQEQAALIDILRRPMAEQVAAEGRRKNGWKK